MADDGLRAKFFKLNVFAEEFVPSAAARTEENDGGPRAMCVDDADLQQHDAGTEEEERSESKWMAKQNATMSDSNIHSSNGVYQKPAEPVNVLFMGHQNAGKSTIVNCIKYLFDLNNKETCKKEQEINQTVEVGELYFETNNKQITFLDSPGKKNFFPNVFGGTAIVDVAILVVSAIPEEFFCKCYHIEIKNNAMLAKSADVKFMVVLINKMDYPTVLWSEKIFEECKKNLSIILEDIGFRETINLKFIPVSGRHGLGISYQSKECYCYWYRDVGFISFIDSLRLFKSRYIQPFTMPIMDIIKEKEITVVTGTVESGTAKKSQSLMLMPNQTLVIVDELLSSGKIVTSVGPGENIEVKLKDVKEENLSLGLVLCDTINPISSCRFFTGQVVILDHNISIAPGYSATLHIHRLAVAIEIKALVCLVDLNTGLRSTIKPDSVEQGQIAVMRIECSELICLEDFQIFPEMGRFTLQDKGKTVAVGKVIHVIR